MQRVLTSVVAMALRRPVLAGTAAAAVALGLGVAFATPGLNWRGSAASAEAPVFAVATTVGAEPAPRPVPDFALTDQGGRRMRLWEQAGKVVLVNFVTTHCATICVQVTRELRGLQQALGDRMGREVVFLSVGLDPQHDTPAALREFARRHDADFTGWAFLSGTAGEMEAARQAFGALAWKVARGSGHDAYDLEHTTVTYLVDRRGIVRRKIPPGLLTLGGLHDIETILASSR
jgi:cytochrome oxidase Cu insertion factor (SCO1/SenC/PrrC family)